MDPMTTLGQIFESTASDLRLFDSNVKSLIKEFAAAALVSENNGDGCSKSDLAATVLQKYRQMTVLFLVKLMNHLVVVNNLSLPCSSCGASQPSCDQNSVVSASEKTTGQSTNNNSVNQLLAPVLAASTDAARLNLSAALTTDTMAAISPLLAAAAVLTPPTSGGPCSSDSARAADENSSSNNNCNDFVNNSVNKANQYALLAQQKLAAIVQMHQQQRQQLLQKQQQSSDSSEKGAANESDAELDESGDGADADVDIADNDDQPIDMSSSSQHVNQQKPVDENRPPLATTRPLGVTISGISSSQLQQHSSASTSSAVSSLISPSSGNVNAAFSAANLAMPPYIASGSALSDALGRVVNRLPLPPNAAAAAAAAAAAGGLLGCNPAVDFTSAYAKFQSAIASAVNSNQRGKSDGVAPSPLAALAQQLFPQANINNGNGNGGNGTPGLLSPAVAGYSQTQQQGSAISPTDALPLCLSSPAGGSSGHAPTISNHAPSGRRASLPPYMLSSQSSQNPALVSPGGASTTASHGSHHISSAGVRTADRYRVVYTSSQTFELEQEYRQNKFITITRKKELARQLGLNERQVKIWFQNRRAKDKRAHRRGGDSGSGGEAGDVKPPKSAKSEIKEEYGDGSAGNAGSCSSVSLNQHDANSNSNSYDGSMQVRGSSERDAGVMNEDVECDDDCDDDCEDLNEDEETEDDGQVAGAIALTQLQQPVMSSVVYPSATLCYNSSSLSSASSSSLSSSVCSTDHLQQQIHNNRLSAANGLPLLLATGGTQQTGSAVQPIVASGNATAMEI